MSDLNAQLLSAHESDDRNALIGLYSRAAQDAANVDAACFYLTHALVFALEAGDPRAQGLREQLVKHGREVAD